MAAIYGRLRQGGRARQAGRARLTLDLVLQAMCISPSGDSHRRSADHRAGGRQKIGLPTRRPPASAISFGGTLWTIAGFREVGRSAGRWMAKFAPVRQRIIRTRGFALVSDRYDRFVVRTPVCAEMSLDDRREQPYQDNWIPLKACCVTWLSCRRPIRTEATLLRDVATWSLSYW